MRKRKKIVLAVGAAALLLLGAALVVGPSLIDADAFRPALEAMARDRLGRDVTLGEIGVSFTPPSLTIADLSIAGASDGAPWLTAKGVRVRASWAGLLSGRLQVQGLALDEPSVRLLRAPDGRWNLVEMLGGRKERATPERLPLDSLRVRRGRVEIADALIAPGTVTRLQFEEVTASISGLSGSGGLDLDVSGAIAGAGRAAWTGRVGPGNELDGHAVLEHLLVAPLAPYLASRTGLGPIDGRLSCDLDVERNGGGVRVRGTAAVESMKLPTAPRGATPVDAAATLDVRVGADGSIDVRRFDVTSGKTAMTARGAVADAPGEQVITIEVESPRASPPDIAALFAAAGQPLPLRGPSTPVAVRGSARIVRRGEPRAVAAVTLDGVTVRGASLAFRKDADGEWRLVGAPPPAPSRQAGPDIRVRNVSLQDASLRLEDATVSPPAVTEIRDVRATVQSWSPGAAGDIDVSGTLAGGRVEMKGRIAAPAPAGARDAPSWDARLSVKDLNLAAAGALLGSTGLAPRSGRASWTAHLTGRPGQDLAAIGQLDLAEARLPLASGREVVLDLPVEHEIHLLESGRIRLTRLGLGLPGGTLELDGRVEVGDTLRYDIGTKGPARLSPEAVAWLAALAGRALPVDLQLTEPAEVDARVRNAGAGLEISGRADIQRAHVRHAFLDRPLEVARARVAFAGDRIDIHDASLRLGESVLEGSLGVERFEAPILVFDLRAPRADLDELFAVAARARSAAPATPPGGPSLASRMRAQGRLRVETATLGGLALSAFDATVDLRDGRLLFDPAGLDLYGGRGRGRLTVDIAVTPARFDCEMALDGVDVRALLQAGMGYQELAGRGRLDVRLQGVAGGLQDTLRTVGGGGTLQLVDGEIGGLNALAALEKASVFGERSLATLAGRLAREGTPFSSLDGEFTLGNGRIAISRARLTAPDAQVDASGTASLLDTRLDLDALVTFSRELSEQMRAEGSRAAEVFWDARAGQVALPTRLVGPMRAPEAKIDWAEAGSRIWEREREEMLGTILGGGRTTGATGTTGPSGPAGATGDTGPDGASGATSSSGRGAEGLLGSILGRGRAPSTPPPAGPPGASTPASPAAGPSLRIDQARMGGSILTPDLRLRATLTGTRLSHAVVLIEDADGRELAREEQAFQAQVAEFYATAPRDSPAEIPVRLTIDSRRLGGGGPFVVKLWAVDAAGRSGEVQRAQVASASPF